LDALRPEDADRLRRCGRPTAAFSDGMRENDRALKRFLFDSMYRHSTVNRMTAKARRVVRELFAFYIEQPDCLPGEWREETERAASPAQSARLIADYIAGMTDRYALEEHQRLFDVYSRQL
jgi:dGTPase